MVFEVPNNDGQQDPSLSKISKYALKTLADGSDGWGGVVAGLNASPVGSSLDIDIAAGYITSGWGNNASTAASVVSLAEADGSSDRVDLIEIDTQNLTFNVVQGVADSNAYEPAVSSMNALAIAVVLVKANDTDIPANQILDRRVAGERYPILKSALNGTPDENFIYGDSAFYIDVGNRRLYGPSDQSSWPSTFQQFDSGYTVVESTYEPGDPLPKGVTPLTRVLRKGNTT